MLMLHAAAHLLVDALCAAAMFGPLAAHPRFPALVLLYNTLAFSTQCFVGMAADRLRRHAQAACGAMLLVVLGYLLPLPGAARVALIGLGNSVFHVAGGAMTLERSGGKAGSLGVFVAPGAVGLTLGTLWPKLGPVFAALLACAAAAELWLFPRASACTRMPDLQPQPERMNMPAVALLTLAVAVRAVGGSAVSFPWKQGAAAGLLLTGFVFAGKTLGGFLCERIGVRRSALVSILPAALLTAFCARWMAPSLLGQLAVNLTMPVTLWLLYRLMPDAPGFAFGLAAAALWPGTIAGKLITLTGPAQWALVLAAFAFSLYAVLYAETRIGKRPGEEMKL